MAAAAKYRNDISGQVNTGGSSTAYTVSSNQVYTSLIDGIVIVARMHTANGASATLNVDSLGAKAIRTHTSTAVSAAALNSGGIYEFTYDSGDDCWYVRNNFSAALLAANNLSDVASAATAFANIKQAATDSATGVVDQATDAEIRAATSGAHAIMAQELSTANALVTLTDAATVAVNWTAGINFTLTLTTDRILGNPTNEIPGTFRTVFVISDGGPDELTFGSEYGGTPPTLDDITTTKGYLLSIYCRAAGQFLVSSMDGSPA